MQVRKSENICQPYIALFIWNKFFTFTCLPTFFVRSVSSHSYVACRSFSQLPASQEQPAELYIVQLLARRQLAALPTAQNILSRYQLTILTLVTPSHSCVACRSCIQLASYLPTRSSQQSGSCQPEDSWQPYPLLRISLSRYQLTILTLSKLTFIFPKLRTTHQQTLTNLHCNCVFNVDYPLPNGGH